MAAALLYLCSDDYKNEDRNECYRQHANGVWTL